MRIGRIWRCCGDCWRYIDQSVPHELPGSLHYCKIKGAIVDTFAANTAHPAVATTLPIHREGATLPYLVQVSTQKVGELALVRIERFARL